LEETSSSGASWLVLGSKCNWNGQVDEEETDRACSTNNEKRNAERLFAVNPEGKRPLARARRRRIDSIDMDLREIEWRCMLD
jgi:hypothetical protein